ncbi:MAG: type II secretion system secretin GspD [Thermodesulfobacteriota bacterium]
MTRETLMPIKAILIAAMLLFATAAPAAETEQPVAPPAPAQEEGPLPAIRLPAEAAPPSAPSGAPAPGAKPPGKPKSGRAPVYISLDFTDVELPVLIKFMSEQTRKNFIFDERVQGKVTIISPRKMTEEEAYNVFLSVLQVKGFTTVDFGNTIKIVPAREARQDTIATDGKGKPGAEFITRLIPLQHVETTEVVQLLTPLLSKDGMISPIASSNTVMLIDTRSNIDRLMGILRLVDVESQGEMKLFQLNYASAQDLAKTLELLFQTSAAPGAPATPAAARGAARRLSPAQGAVVKFIPEARTNHLIVLAPPDVLNDVADLIARLDVAGPAAGGKINVYYLENADAEEVAKVLSSLSGSQPGQVATQVRPPATAAQPAARALIAAELEGGVKVTADKATNSLVIVASPNDYETLVQVIRKLDIRRRQVFVEAAIMEITLDKGLDVGVEFRGAFQTSKKDDGAVLTGTNFDFAGNINSLLGSLATGNPLVFSGTGLLAGGIGGNVKLPDGTEVPAVAAILRAAQTNDNVKILSSPHLLTQNNKEAEIIVGSNVPFITSQSRDSTNLANVINTVERKDVGVTLRITPHIHESEFVSLDIYQESSALQATSLLDTSSVGPTTTKRSAKTTVLVKSGDTVVIGGIVQETDIKNESKVPLLGDIPLLGYLFRFKSTSKNRTNLVILLTPHIITEPGMLNKALEDRQRRLLGAFDPKSEEIQRALPQRKEEVRP